MLGSAYYRTLSTPKNVTKRILASLKKDERDWNNRITITTMKRYQKDCASIPSLQGKPPRQAIHLSSGQTNSPCQKSWSPKKILFWKNSPFILSEGRHHVDWLVRDGCSRFVLSNENNYVLIVTNFVWCWY